MAVYKAGSPTLFPRQHRFRQAGVYLLIIIEIFAVFFVLYSIYRRDTTNLVPVEGSAVSGG